VKLKEDTLDLLTQLRNSIDTWEVYALVGGLVAIFWVVSIMENYDAKAHLRNFLRGGAEALGALFLVLMGKQNDDPMLYGGLIGFLAADAFMTLLLRKSWKEALVRKEKFGAIIGIGLFLAFYRVFILENFTWTMQLVIWAFVIALLLVVRWGNRSKVPGEVRDGVLISKEQADQFRAWQRQQATRNGGETVVDAEFTEQK
jgi:hypothetical protein